MGKKIQDYTDDELQKAYYESSSPGFKAELDKRGLTANYAPSSTKQAVHKDIQDMNNSELNYMADLTSSPAFTARNNGNNDDGTGKSSGNGNNNGSGGNYGNGDPNASYQNYLNAKLALDNVASSAPAFKSSLDDDLMAIYSKIVNKGKPVYDINGDELYKMYKDQYINNGRLAMEDTIGQSAALTGGYGNSYATGAGYQAYQRYLEGLNDVVPQLYDRYMDNYNRDTEELYNQYQMTKGLRDDEYDKYIDRYKMAKDNEQDAYSRWLTEREYADNQKALADKNAKSEADNYYNRLVSLMSNGYNPTADELNKAGITSEQAKYLMGGVPSPDASDVNSSGDSDYAVSNAEHYSSGKALNESLTVGNNMTDRIAALKAMYQAGNITKKQLDDLTYSLKNPSK